jgi:outer membrane protein OmpA-like peptidoglycan-associated protein
MKPVRQIGVLLPAVLILVSGCATKDWVREAMQRKSIEIGTQVEGVDQRVDTVGKQVETVDQKVVTVDGRVTQAAGRIDQVGTRVDKVEGSVTEANETAKGAKDLGNSALAKADDVDKRLTRLWTNRHNARLVDTVQVFFGFDRAELDDRAQTALANMAKDLQGNPNLIVELTGHTDARGPREYNYQLSQRRVESVRRFLVEKGVQMSRIQSVGLGPVAEPGAPDPEKRRVTAKMMIEQD